MEFIKVCAVSDLPPGSGRRFNYGTIAVAVFNVDGAFHAIDNTCQHEGGSLGDGVLSGDVVACPLHEWEYNVKTGANCTMKMDALPTYETKVDGEDLLVRMKPD